MAHLSWSLVPPDAHQTPPRRLLGQLRDVMERDSAPLKQLVGLIAAAMVSEVCSAYVRRPGDILELAATHGLNQEAVGQTRLRVGEGIIGLCAASGRVMNLPDAQNHPAFAYRPETGEEPYASMLAVPVRRAGRTLGVLAVQNRMPRQYDPEEVDEAETAALLLAEVMAAAGAAVGEEGVAATVPRTFAGVALVGGVVVGPVILHGTRRVPTRLLTDDPEAEVKRLREGIERMQRGLDELMEQRISDARDGDAPREVLEAYRLIAADTGWLGRVQEVIRSGLSASAAVQRVAGELHDRMRRVADPYIRERLADLEDMAGRLMAALEDEHDRPPVQPGAILLARRLGPAELLEWHGRGIAGIAVEDGTQAGHAAIIARALGLPALGGTRGAATAAEPGDIAVLDGDEGTLILRPELDVQRAYERANAERNLRQGRWAGLRDRPAGSADGVRIQVMLNLGLALELGRLDAVGADGIGLFRTEIAMLAQGTIADVSEQAALYSRVLDAAAGRPVVFRTLDLGSDKMLPGAEQPEEANPAMGWRSLRIGLDRPAVLRRQLRALLLGAAGRALTVMFPMVATVAEFRAARALLLAEAERVRPAPERLTIGTMLEVPALLWQLPELLGEVEFVSIGSNDLLQFTFAADRGAPLLAGRYDFLSPAMLNLLEHVLAAAAAARDGQGVPISLCGEAAGRPLEALALVGLGLRTLSMPAPGVLPVKAMLAGLDLGAFRPVLAALRNGAAGETSLREPIAAWAREHGVAV